MHRQADENKSAFTLVELLAVIAIMAILLSITIASFQNIKGKGLNAALTPLSSTLRLARQYAVSQRTTTYVVFPGERDVIYGNEPEQVKKAGKAYAVIASNRTSHVYEYIANWDYLPQGVTFITDDAYAGGETPFNSYANAGQGADFPFPNDSSSPQPLCSLMFKSNGRVYTFSRTSGRWVSGIQAIHIPLTTARLLNVDTNAGHVVSAMHIAGVTNELSLNRMTGQVRFSE